MLVIIHFILNVDFVTLFSSITFISKTSSDILLLLESLHTANFFYLLIYFLYSTCRSDLSDVQLCNIFLLQYL